MKTHEGGFIINANFNEFPTLLSTFYIDGDPITDLLEDYRQVFLIVCSPAVANQAWVHPEQSVVIDFVTRAICLWSFCKYTTRIEKKKWSKIFALRVPAIHVWIFLSGRSSAQTMMKKTTWCNIIMFISASCIYPLSSHGFTSKRGEVCALISESIMRLSWQEKLNYNQADCCPVLRMWVNWIQF